MSYDEDLLLPGKGSDINLRVRWLFELDRTDALLILKALGGRLKEGRETEAAKELGDILTKRRAAEARELYERLQHHADNVGQEEGSAK